MRSQSLTRCFYVMWGQIGASDNVKPPDLFQGTTQNGTFWIGGWASPRDTSTVRANIFLYIWQTVLRKSTFFLGCVFEMFPYKMYILIFFYYWWWWFHLHNSFFIIFFDYENFDFDIFFSQLWYRKTLKKLVLVGRQLNILHSCN